MRSDIDITLQFKAAFQDFGNQMFGIVQQSPLAFTVSTMPETLNVLNKQCPAMLLKAKLLTRTIIKLQKRKQFNLSKIFPYASFTQDKWQKMSLQESRVNGSLNEDR